MIRRSSRHKEKSVTKYFCLTCLYFWYKSKSTN